MIAHCPSMPLTLAMLTLLTLGGCTYRYVTLEPEQGKRCVEKLDARAAQCKQRAQEAAHSQRESYEFQMVSYRVCTQQTR